MYTSNVYIPLQLYASEPELSSRHQRSVLKIRWNDFIANDEVLDRANTDIEIMLTRKANDRRVEAFLFGELTEAPRRVGLPPLIFKDTLKSILKCGRVLETWKDAIEIFK